MSFAKTPVLLFTVVLGIGACTPPNQQASGGCRERGTCVDENDTTVGEQTKITWVSAPPVFSDKGIISTVSSTAAQYCFQNNSRVACRRPAEGEAVRTELGTAPIMIQSFQPQIMLDSLSNNAANVYSAITITRATVTMGYLTINTGTGRAGISKQHTRQIYGARGEGCDAAAANSVGSAAQAAGEEHLMTGIYLYDDGANSGGVFGSSFLGGGRVLYSGIKPVASTAEATYLYDYVPATDFESGSFGVNGFVTGAPTLRNKGTYTIVPPASVGSDPLKLPNSAQMATLLPFGFDQSYIDAESDPFLDQNWKEFVIIGFCIEGTKTYSAGGATRPLFLRAEATLQKPVMSLK